MTRSSSRVTTRDRPQRLYVYKLTVDNGGAPCTHGGELLTLAICKPFIRTTAAEGDLIFGFAANRLSADNRLIYIARVTEVLRDGEYYDSRSYRRRPDCIYVRGDDGRFEIRADARYHESGHGLTHDLGEAYNYRRAIVLASDDFRYFGAKAADFAQSADVREMLRGLKQGHRRNHPVERENALRSLQEWAWTRYADRKVIGRPTQPVPTAQEETCG